MTAPTIDIDLFAGPGGWDEGGLRLGLRPVGIEWDDVACRTAAAAGHHRIRADVSTYPTGHLRGRVRGLIASPPCQAWSMAGKRKGEKDRANCYALVDAMAGGRDSLDVVWEGGRAPGVEWEDPRSPLVAQPVRWARDLEPEWIAFEQVPDVLDLWRHIGRIFQGWGYSVWCGVLNAADYGVPQTRRRAFLIASRTRTVAPPSPTHCSGQTDDLFTHGLLPWVTMARALGWDRDNFVRRERSGDRAKEGFDATADPAQCLTSKARSWLRMGNRERAAIRHVEEPAPTVLFGARSNKVEWFEERPATTVVASFSPDVISPPGYRLHESRQNAEGGVRVTVAEGGVLQSFRADYPWQGSRSKQFEQVGNAVPPLLAAHVLSAASGIALDSAEVAA